MGSTIKLSMLAVLVFFTSGWITNLDSAMESAKKSDRNIILVFAGSDWCTPCIKLEKEIWESEAFKTEAKDNWILVKADFPKKKANALPADQAAHNAKLYEKYNKEGVFPLVVMLDKTGKVLGKTSYKGMMAENYIKHLHSLEKK